MAALMGKLLLLAGCSALGVLRGWELKKRTACLGDLRRILAALSRELAFSLRPIPDLLAGVRGEGPAHRFFSACLEEFHSSGQESWAESWQRALDASSLPLSREDLGTLEEAGQVLGRYDGDSQRQALAGILARLEDSHAQARREEERLFRVYAALGVAAGLFACILL